MKQKSRRLSAVMTSIVCMDILFIYILYTMNGLNNGTEEALITKVTAVENYVNDEVEEVSDIVETNKNVGDFQGEFDASMENILKTQLTGKYIVGEKIQYEFDENGGFSGYFDVTHPYVVDFLYGIVIEAEIPYVYIYNKEKTMFVSYELQLNKMGNICLYYKAADLQIELKK